MLSEIIIRNIKPKTLAKRRNDIDISADILKIAADGAKKSHIVYRANLNFQVVKKYLDRLENAGLLDFPSVHDRIFKTTSKGMEYLDRYENLLKYME